jgi:hypothetical protein
MVLPLQKRGDPPRPARGVALGIMKIGMLGSEPIFGLNRHAPQGAWHLEPVDFVNIKKKLPF